MKRIFLSSFFFFYQKIELTLTDSPFCHDRLLFGFPVIFFFSFFSLQFLSCIVHAVLVFGGHALGTEHVYPRHLSWLQVMYHPVMLFLFLTQLYWVPNWLVGETATQSMKEEMKKNKDTKRMEKSESVGKSSSSSSNSSSNSSNDKKLK